MTQVLQSSPVSEISLEAALSMGSEAWDQLALAHPFPSVFMSWAWHRAWLEGSPTRDTDTAVVLTDFSPGSGVLPTVILPLAYRRRSFYRCPVPALGWCAVDVGTPDHLDILAVEGTDWANDVVNQLDARSWNLLVLTSLEEESPKSRLLLEALEAKGCHSRIERVWPCAQIHLPDRWETYLDRLSGKRRYRIRKDENQLRSNHNVRVREFDLGSLDEGWGHLVRLHRARWSGGGSFEDQRLSSVYGSFARILAEQGRLGLMALEVDDEIVAIDFWAEFGRTMFGLQSGRDPQWDRSSVGRVLRALVIKKVIASGLQTADFSRGGDPYKREWCPEERWCFEAVVFRNTWRGSLLRYWQAAAVGSRPLRIGWRNLLKRPRLSGSPRESTRGG